MSAGTSVPQNVPQIPGFQLTGLLGQGAMSQVFRGLREGRPYAIKLMKSDERQHDTDAALRFRREASVIARLDHPGLVKVVEVGESQGRPFLVMELVEGESLEQRLKRGSLSEPELLAVAKSVSQGLSEVHRHGLVHRDLKPANIILLPNGQAKIIDFGFVGTVEEGGSSEGDGEVVGTFLYAAPEQTGMLKRKVDSRADIYALGAIFFECATGKPPFMAQNLAELLHMHAAIKPPNAHDVNPAVRPALGLIINKLLAKDPDDRYQTCLGLLADLESLAELEAAQKFGRPVTLGTRDASLYGGFEVPLVGRATEMTSLGKYWAQARTKKGAMVQVEGEGGSGKTRLVRELIKMARAEGAVILTGKAQQGERTPFGPLREALDNYLSSLLKLPQDVQGPALQKIKAAAGDFGGIVKRLSRSLQNLFADARDLPPLDPMDEQRRFYEKVTDFLTEIIKGVGPTILLVDDVQWIDEGSTEILHQLVERARDLPLLIVSAARNDPQSDAARSAFLKRMGDSVSETFTLGALDNVSVNELVAAHLGGKRLDPSVVERINARARGNPFALGEYVRALLDAGMIRPTFGSWTVDATRFHEAGISNDVIALLVNRIRALSEGTRAALETAAVIGFEFPLSILTDSLGGKVEVTRRAMEEALRAGLVEKVDISYHFIHDRVYEAMITGIDPARARDLNQRVAEALERLGDQTPAMLHALARHYARGYAEKHQDKIYETSLRAGVHALESFSNQDAVELLGRAYRAAEIVGVSAESKAMVSELLGVACTRTGRLDAATAHFRGAMAQGKTKEDQSRLHYLLGNALASKGRQPEARVELELALKLIGAPVPAGKGGQIFAILGNLIRFWFQRRTGIGYGRAKGEDRRRLEAISNIQGALSLLVIMMNDPLAIILIATRNLTNGHALGTSREYAKALADWGLSMGLMGAGGVADKFGKLGVGMARQLGDPETLVHCAYGHSIGLEMAGDVNRAQKMMEELLPDMLRYGNSWDSSTLIAQMSIAVFGTGRARESVDWLLGHMDTLHRGGFASMIIFAFSNLYAQLTVLGRIPDALKARDQARRMVATATDTMAKGHHWSSCVWALYEQGDYGPEFEHAVKELAAQKRREFQNSHGFVALMYARLDQFLRAAGKEARAKAREQLKAAKKLFLTPPPCAFVPFWKVHASVVDAAVARSEKQYRKAKKLLDDATEVANQFNNLWARWCIARERARLASETGDEQNARRQVETAVNIARREGWQGRVSSLEREFGALARPPVQVREQESVVTQGAPSPNPAAGSQWFSSRTGAKVRMIETERQMEALLQVSLATASSLDPVEQARAALDELVMLLGAERAFLFAVDPQRGGLEMQAGRDASKNDLLALSGFSSTVVNKAFSTGEALVVSGTDEGEALGSESAVAHNLRSIMAAPLMMRDSKLGVVYLDSTLAKGMFGKQHLRVLQPICNFIAISLQTGRMARVEATQKALEKDMQLTAAVQSLFLPKEVTSKNAAVGVSGYYRPATQCGGDWWWYEPMGDKGMRVLLGDVTGHGAASAMVTASVASAFQFLRRTATGRNTAELVQELGQHLRNTTEGAYYMTLSAVELDGAAGKLRWWNAGSPPLFIRRKTGEIEVVNLPGAPLGSSGAPPGFTEVDVAPGERILVFTDGVSELNLPNKKQLG
ncbi:MAG TPA: protein kinase, partial [Myxococcaceae bacterium]